jgi:hypothetical protein
MSHSSKFEFDCTEFINDNFRMATHHKVINRFTSPFWTERRWLLKYEVDADVGKTGLISYKIRPYKFNDNDPLMTKFANQYESNDRPVTSSSSVQLTIVHHDFVKWTSRSFIG